MSHGIAATLRPGAAIMNPVSTAISDRIAARKLIVKAAKYPAN